MPFKNPIWSAVSQLSLPIGAICLSLGAQAAEGELEEIVVTSQKRAQSLQDVSASVVAIQGYKIDELGIENIEDLSTLASNIHLTETGISTQLRVRGIGSDNSQGFEQSVGVYVDGIYRGRAQLFRAPIFDLERVEIMRGPQSILFGKNSIAGALDLITAKPEEELGGSLAASYESEFGTQEVSGHLTGPINEQLSARLALRYYDDPGYMENTYKGEDEPQQLEQSARASIAWNPDDNIQVLWTSEHHDLDINGRAIEVTQDEPLVVDGAARPSYGQIIQSLNGGNTFDAEQDYKRQTNTSESSDNKIDSHTLRIDYDYEGYTLTLLSGLLSFDYVENCDCDFTPADILNLDLFEDYQQFSQEIRLASPLDQKVSWLAGAFFQNYSQEFSDVLSVSPGAAFLSPFIANPAIDFGGTGVMREFQQDSDAKALFAEATWNATDSMHITLGARYTQEVKEASKVMNVISPLNDNAVINSPQLGGAYLAVFRSETEQSGGHNLSDQRREYAFTPSLNISIDVSENVMAYGQVSTGFKAGGYDPRSNNTANFEFEEEKVKAYEIGYKMRVNEGRGEVNLALFRMDYEDLQISQFDGGVGFNVGNAKETLVQGLELDGRWKLSENLNANYSMAYLDFEYKDFENGNCHYPDTLPGNPVTSCDYTGERGVYTPELTFNGGLDYSRNINNSLYFVTALDMQWVDKQQVHVNLDPKGEVDAYALLNLRVAIEDDAWSVALLGKNLLDEDIVSYSANLPLSETFAQSNSYYSFVRRPRTLALETRFKF